MSRIGRIVEWRDYVHRTQLRQRLEKVPRPDAVAAVGRPGQPVRQEQDLVFHPNPRAISGPRRLATDSGRRCHIRTGSENRGSSGLTLRFAVPGAVREA